MKRIRVPEERIQRFADEYGLDFAQASDQYNAVMKDLAKHPPVPTDEQAAALLEIFYSHECDGKDSAKRIVVEWQRRCFVEEEPEPFEEIEDLIFTAIPGTEEDTDATNQAIVEAYRRGLRKGGQK